MPSFSSLASPISEICAAVGTSGRVLVADKINHYLLQCAHISNLSIKFDDFVAPSIADSLSNSLFFDVRTKNSSLPPSTGLFTEKG